MAATTATTTTAFHTTAASTVTINTISTDCREYDEWSSSEDSYLAGRAQDATGSGIPRRMYSDLDTAKQECLSLDSGCGGVTGKDRGYSIRFETSFMPSSTGEVSYLKPNNPCQGKYGNLLMNPNFNDFFIM